LAIKILSPWYTTIFLGLINTTKYGALSDKSIRRALEEGEIAIDPLDEDNIEPASVDLTLGNEAFLRKDDEKRWLEEGDMLVLPPGATTIVLTRERVELGNTIAANIGLRSHFTRQCPAGYCRSAF